MRVMEISQSGVSEMQISDWRYNGEGMSQN